MHRSPGTSPALVVSVLALFAALGGVAAASPDAFTSASAKKTAKKAAKKARKAKQLANQAQGTANAAQSAASQAQGAADQAQGTADQSRAAADQAQEAADQAGAKVAGITEAKANTVTLSDGGSQTLFQIGGVTLIASCSTPVADLRASIQPITQAGSDGQRLIVDGDSGSPDELSNLTFNSVDFVLSAFSDGNLAAQEASFAIIDGANSARGVVAATADRNADECELTAHVVR